ncbi:MAG: protease pro-enzyme activation domain-containing protein [Capsulimonadaceae bacterium]
MHSPNSSRERRSGQDAVHSQHWLAAAALALTLCAAHSTHAQNPGSQARVTLSDDRPAVSRLLATARYIGHQSPDTMVNVAFALPMRNQTQLVSLVHRVYDPNDPLYHHFLTPQEVNNSYNPAASDYQAVIAYAREAGFTITRTYANRVLVDASAPTSVVESAFDIRLNRYLMPDGHVGHVNDVAPSVPADIAARITGVIGLDTLTRRHHYHHGSALDQTLRTIGHLQVGTGPVGGYAPTDVHQIYQLNTSLQGSGQSVALYELDGFNQADIDTYVATFGLPSPNVLPVYVDGFDGIPVNVDGETEVVLDIDMVSMMAPQLQNLYVYQADGTNGPETAPIDVLNQIVSDQQSPVSRTISALSTSWGSAEVAPVTTEEETEFTDFLSLISEGVSVYAASGDNGADTAPGVLSVDDPASQPYVCGVGGTSLLPTTTSNDPVITNPNNDTTSYNWAGETTWNDAEGASGGGISAIWSKDTPLATYQWDTTTGTPAVNGTGSATPVLDREVPDVSFNADPETGYDIFVTDDGGWVTVGGTSAAAPIWAGFTALVDQNRALLGSNNLGMPNNTIYAVGENEPITYAAAFHDITTGYNGTTSTNGYSALKGFDDATGWGSPVFNQLLPVLALGPGGTKGLDGHVSGTLTGTVTDAGGNPVQYAIVTVRETATGDLVGTAEATPATTTTTQTRTSDTTNSTSVQAPPTALTAVATNSAGIGPTVLLTWTAGASASSYNVYRATKSNGENTATALATGVTTTAYSDTTVSIGTSYYYEVAAVGANGTSTLSNEANATPSIIGTAITDINGNYTLVEATGVSLSVSVDGPAPYTTSTTPPTTTPEYEGSEVTGVVIPVNTSTNVGETYTLDFTTSDLCTASAPVTCAQPLILAPAGEFPYGLQMISSPYDYTNVCDFSTLFGLTADPPAAPPLGIDPTLFVWNSSAESYSTTPANPADTLHVGVGYWVDFQAGSNSLTNPTGFYLHRQGVATSTGTAFNIPLVAGWNMIGDPFPQSEPLNTFMVQVGTQEYNLTSTQNKVVALPFFTWPAYNPDSPNYETIDGTGSLTPYYGYWVYSSKNAVLIIPGGGTAPSPP